MPEPNATPAPRPLAQPPLTMKASTEWHLRGTYGKGPLFAELDATRAKLAEAEAQRDADQRAHVVSMNAKHEMWEQAIALRDTSAAQLEALWPLLTAAESRVAALTEALKEAEWGGAVINEIDEAVGDACPVCHGLKDADRAYGQYRAGHSTACILYRALSPSQDAKDGGAV